MGKDLSRIDIDNYVIINYNHRILQMLRMQTKKVKRTRSRKAQRSGNKRRVVRVKRTMKGAGLFSSSKSPKVGPAPGNGPLKTNEGEGPPKPMVGRWSNGPLEPRKSRATPTGPGFSNAVIAAMRNQSWAGASKGPNSSMSVGKMFASANMVFPTAGKPLGSGYNTVISGPSKEGPYAGLGPDRKLYGSAGKPAAGEKPYNTVITGEGNYISLGNPKEGDYMEVESANKGLPRSPSGNSGYGSNGNYNSVV